MSFKTFPYTILPNGKRIPLIDDWQNKASADPEQHRIWVEQFRDRIKGYALPMGAINGLYALDIDVKDGRNGFEYLKSQGIQLPNTAWQQTPSGGCHLFFRYDPNDGLKNTVNREIGIDSRSDNGFVWLYDIQNLQNIQPVPEWVKTIVRKPINHIDPTQLNTYQIPSHIGQQKFNEALDMLRNAQEGERNHTLNKVSYMIGQLVAAQAVPYDYAYEQINQVARSIGLEPFEIQATSLSGLKGGAANPLTHPFGDAPPAPALKIEAPLPQAETPSRWTPKFATLDMLSDWSKLKRPQLFEDWSPQDILLTSAIGGVGKTTIKLYEAVCLGLGDPFLGFKCLNPGRTLFIVGEDTEAKLYAMVGRIAKQIGLYEPGQEYRLQAVADSVIIKRAKDVPLVAFNKALNNYVPNTESLGKIQQAIEDLRPKQIVFDPIGMFAGPESGGNDAARAMMETMQIILDMSDAAVEMISHIGKDSHTRKDTGQFSARGATAIANHSRVVRTLLKLNEDEYRDATGEDLEDETTAIQCFVSKFSDGSPILDKPFIILRKGFAFSKKDIPLKMQSLGGDNAKDKLRVLEFIRRNSTEDRPLTPQVIADHFYMETPRINKIMTKTFLGLLQFERVIEIIPHVDVTIGDWVRAI